MACLYLFLMGHTRASFCLFSVFFKQFKIQFFLQINVKNIHPVYGAGIRTHGIQIESRIP